MYGRCDARPTVTFPAPEHGCPAADHAAWLQRKMCVNDLPKVARYLAVKRPRVEPATIESQAIKLEFHDASTDIGPREDRCENVDCRSACHRNKLNRACRRRVGGDPREDVGVGVVECEL